MARRLEEQRDRLKKDMEALEQKIRQHNLEAETTRRQKNKEITANKEENKGKETTQKMP